MHPGCQTRRGERAKAAAGVPCTACPDPEVPSPELLRLCAQGRADGVGGILQSDNPIHRRPHRTGGGELSDGAMQGFALPSCEPQQSLSHNRIEQGCTEVAWEAAEPTPPALATDDDEHPARRQDCPQLTQRPVAGNVDDRVERTRQLGHRHHLVLAENGTHHQAWLECEGYWTPKGGAPTILGQPNDKFDPALAAKFGALDIDAIGLNCATGPAEMSEHLRYLSKHAGIPVMAMPNAGLPQLGPNGAVYPLTPDELAVAEEQFVREFGLGLVGGCCGTTPAHMRAVVERLGGERPAPREVTHEDEVASLYQPVSLRQDASFLAIGERTNANGSKAFREAMLAANWDECVAIAKSQSRQGAHLADVCVDYVGRDGAADMTALTSRLATAATLPVMIDSTEPAVVEAALNHLPGRSIINSVNFEDGDGPGSRFARVMPLVREHGAAVVALTIDEEGQARTAEWKLRVAERLIEQLTNLSLIHF